MAKESVYITRDEDSDVICLWRKPPKGLWAPKKYGEDIVNWQRADRNVEYLDMYTKDDFKKKFGITIRKKTKKLVHLDATLVNDGRLLMMTPVDKIVKKR